MSISDEMMWRYYELLTDVQLPEIEKMKAEAHPMQAKKELARRIVQDFHSTEAAAKAGEDWAKQRQKELRPDNLPGHIDEIQVSYENVKTDDAPSASNDTYLWIKLDRLLVSCGLADSITDAGRKRKARAVYLLRPDGSVGEVWEDLVLPVVFSGFPVRLPIRVGKKVVAAVIGP